MYILAANCTHVIIYMLHITQSAHVLVIGTLNSAWTETANELLYPVLHACFTSHAYLVFFFLLFPSQRCKTSMVLHIFNGLFGEFTSLPRKSGHSVYQPRVGKDAGH